MGEWNKCFILVLYLELFTLIVLATILKVVDVFQGIILVALIVTKNIMFCIKLIQVNIIIFVVDIFISNEEEYFVNKYYTCVVIIFISLSDLTSVHVFH